MKKIIIIFIISIFLVSVVMSQSIIFKDEIKYIDGEPLNLTKTEKQRLDSSYENLKLGKVIDYKQTNYHTFINMDSGYRVITRTNNFNKMKNAR